MTQDPRAEQLEKMTEELSAVKQENEKLHKQNTEIVDTLMSKFQTIIDQQNQEHKRQIAALLGFHGVKYSAGSYFSRKTEVEEPSFQIDLLFDREDKVMTICEIKYSQIATSSKVIDEFEKKLHLLPNGNKKTIQKVLISNRGADSSLIRRTYFDAFIQVDDFFQPHIWI